MQILYNLQSVQAEQLQHLLLFPAVPASPHLHLIHPEVLFHSIPDLLLLQIPAGSLHLQLILQPVRIQVLPVYLLHFP